jgi:SNF2 family DNA or RNA helicase
MTWKQLLTPSSVPWTPHPYQKKGVKFLIERDAAALFLDPGLGKTSIVLAALKILKKKGFIRKTWIVAPLRVCHSVWPVELKKWADFHGLSMIVLHGTNKDERINEDADIYVVNYDGLKWLIPTKTKRLFTNGEERFIEVTDEKEFKKRFPDVDVIVFDELSRMKHVDTNRFKLLKPLLPLFKRRWGLTGSPVANGLLDLFGQCYTLDLGKALSPFITHYRANYFFRLPNDVFTWRPIPGAEDKIFIRLKNLALRMAAEDYIKMPQVIVKDIFVDLPDAARSVYEDMENDLLTVIDDKTFTAVNAGVASMKCRQIVNGAIYRDDALAVPLLRPKIGKREWVEIHDQKIEALLNLIAELNGRPLFIAYEFKHDLARLLKALGKNTPNLGSGVSTNVFKEIERKWNNGEIPVLLGHPQSVAHGLNLQHSGGYICWFSLTWNYELYDQFNRRVIRQGNESGHVFVYHIIARNTIDRVVYYALQHKHQFQQRLFTALKEMSHGRKKG